jgi:hypothetical protein
MKSSVCRLLVSGVCLSVASGLLYGAPSESVPLPVFHPDSLWEQVNTCILPGTAPHQGIYYDRGTIWHVTNVTGQPFNVFRCDTLGNFMHQFANPTQAYALGVCRIGDSIFVSWYSPTPQRICVFDTAGNPGRTFSLSNGGACAGIDFDQNTQKLWIWGSPTPGTVNINICDRTGTVSKTIAVAGGNWTYGGAIDRRYYPDRMWYAERQGDFFNYCSVDTAAGTAAILASFASPDQYVRGITYLDQAGQSFVWINTMSALSAYKMRVHGPVGVADETRQKAASVKLSVFPNPTRGREVVFHVAFQGPVTLNIYNRAGARVAQLIGRARLVWNAGGMPAGLYFVRVRGPGVGTTARVVLVD